LGGLDGWLNATMYLKKINIVIFMAVRDKKYDALVEEIRSFEKRLANTYRRNAVFASDYVYDLLRGQYMGARDISCELLKDFRSRFPDIFREEEAQRRKRASERAIVLGR
jgi:hypothetical protein